MHKVVKERLEDYLRGTAEPEALAECRSHLATCERCRREVEAMEKQAGLLGFLRAPEPIEPRAGFYGRVIEAIEEASAAPVWAAFLDPVFAKRLIYACLLTVLVLGSFLVYSEQTPQFDASSPVAIMASGPEGRQHVGTDPQVDREVVLVSLASYQE